MWAAPPASSVAATFEGDDVRDFIYWVENVGGLQAVVPDAQYNFIKAHFSKTVKQEHDSWIMKEKVKALKAATPYIAKDVDNLHTWLETTYRLHDSKVTITNLHTLIKRDIVSRMSSSDKPDSHTLIKLFLQGCLPDDQKELVKYSIDSSRVPVTDFDKFLDHVDTQDSHNQMLDQIAGGQSVRENVFLHMVAPPVVPDPEPIPVAPALSAAPAVSIDDLTAEFLKMALHVTSGKALNTYQLSHAQSEQFKTLYLVFCGPAVVSSPASSNISKGVVTVANDRGFERRKFDVTKLKCFFCRKSWKETPEGNHHLRSDCCGLLWECIKKGWSITEDLCDLETGEMWRMKDGKLIYELLKEKVEAGSVSMSTGKARIGESTVLVASDFGSCAFHLVVLDKSNVQYLDIGDREFRLLTDMIGVFSWWNGEKRWNEEKRWNGEKSRDLTRGMLLIGRIDGTQLMS
ncbi:hypothetical protein HDU80_002705 [Chytriomyces hyalinus]|nr:hypothetical protein HDU80_002705 [Chytriomyces hyalinus]